MIRYSPIIIEQIYLSSQQSNDIYVKATANDPQSSYLIDKIYNSDNSIIINNSTDKLDLLVGNIDCGTW